MSPVTTNLPQVFYGLHFQPGVAEYKDGENILRVFINERTAKKMDPTMAAKPLVVDHIDKLPETRDGIKQIADGYVSESFYCPDDGAHWAKFVAVTDKALHAIASGWALSNAYHPTEYGQGGKHHAVDYDKEILNGEYEHLAIVERPRYEASKILTPEQFKQYCADKKTELARLANSKETPKKQGAKSVLNIFKRTKVENSADFDEMVVRLPKSGRELTLTALVNEMDKFSNGEGYANPDHLVKVGNDEMSVSEMADCYGKMKSSMEEEEKKKKENAESQDKDADKSQEKKEEKMGNEESEEEKKKKEKEEKEKEEKKMNQAEYDRFKNKADTGSMFDKGFPMHNEDSPIVLPIQGVKRGQSRYGSGK